MTYVVDERCIKCKTTDCVAVCPVNCFYEGDNKAPGIAWCSALQTHGPREAIHALLKG